MVRAHTTKEQLRIAKERGCALFAFACKSGGTFACDGPIDHAVAAPLIRLMSLIVADCVTADELRAFVETQSQQKTKRGER